MIIFGFEIFLLFKGTKFYLNLTKVRERFGKMVKSFGKIRGLFSLTLCEKLNRALMR